MELTLRFGLFILVIVAMFILAATDRDDNNHLHFG